MTIPNKLCLALVGSFFAAAMLAGLSLETIGWHALASIVALVVTFGLFVLGVFGGGDAKLTAAIALWLGPSLAFEFALLTGVLGGALTLAVLVFRANRHYLIAINAPWATRLLSADVGIPYGIALSGAAMIVMTQSIWFKLAIAL
ncbi:MAG: prepilin peptidase [Pseudomonadota bacterium]